MILFDAAEQVRPVNACAMLIWKNLLVEDRKHAPMFAEFASLDVHARSKEPAQPSVEAIPQARSSQVTTATEAIVSVPIVAAPGNIPSQA